MSSSSATAHKRFSTVPNEPLQLGANHRIHSTALVHEKASLVGDYNITVAANAVIHPYAKLVATHGPIEIGECCVVWERGSVGLLEGAKKSDENIESGVILEKHVVIEANATIEAARVGEHSIIEVGAKVGQGALLGKYTRLAPLTTLADHDILPDYTVVYGQGCLRRVNMSLEGSDRVRTLQENGHLRHVELMKSLVGGIRRS